MIQPWRSTEIVSGSSWKQNRKIRWRTILVKWEVACGLMINILTVGDFHRYNTYWWLPPNVSRWFIKVYNLQSYGFFFVLGRLMVFDEVK